MQGQVPGIEVCGVFNGDVYNEIPQANDQVSSPFFHSGYSVSFVGLGGKCSL